MISTRFPETFTRSILSCMKIVEKKEMYNKMVCRFFILSIKPFSNFKSLSDSHYSSYTSTHSPLHPPNEMQNAMFSVLP